MKIKEVIDIIEDWAPRSYAEDFDNTGLLTGNAGDDLQGILVTLDCLETVVDEAIDKGCNLIVAFHPIVFGGLKSITGKNYVERTVIKAIKNDIAIYAIHTALDNSYEGVNAAFSEAIGLGNRKILLPKSGVIRKLTTYVPTANAAELRSALFAAGAGSIGNYDNCSFNFDGNGTYRGNENSNPVIGERGQLHTEAETCVTVTFEKHLESKVLKAMQVAHPYEEVAYEVMSLENTHQHIGMGMVGELSEAMDETSFLAHIKNTFNCGGIRHSALRGKKIKKVAVLGGSGAFAIKAAIGAGADAYVSADFKYHEFYSAENRILVMDIGHYESEQFTKKLLVDFLSEKIPNFVANLSKVNTNPIYYY